MQTVKAFRGDGRPELSGIVQHVFLIAGPGSSRPRVIHRGNPLHAMQMVLVSAEDASWPVAGAIGPLPPAPSPQVLLRPAASAPSLAPREIKGEILRDRRGRLYEMIGDHVRPVNQLCRDQRGQVIDLLPLRAAETAVEPGAQEPTKAVETSVDDQINDAECGAESAEVATQEHSFRKLARKLSPDPGFWRVVRYADFIDALTPQLSAPQRLRPGHQLACYVQVYELFAQCPLAALERMASEELGAAGKLVPLSYELCRRFGLSLPRPAFALAATQAYNSPGIVFPGARFITLRVALDPTVDTRSEMTAASAPLAPNAPVASIPATARTAIPEEFGKPWEFRHARDEAIYDMQLAASRSGFARLVDGLFRRVTARDMKKWLSLLNGKSTDQQLWCVKPPRGAFHDARVRRWLVQTLQLGGYDVPRMQAEWEIHWRRQLD